MPLRSSRCPAARIVLSCLAVAFGSSSAGAQTNPACSALPNPIYGVGGSQETPLIRWIGAQLAGAAAPATVVYASPGACFGIDGVLNGTPVIGNANYWLADGTQKTCTLPAVTGQVVDFGVLGHGASLCAGVSLPLPPTVGDFPGPVTSSSVIVNELSTETSISSGAIKYIYGQGAAADVAPWNDDAYLFHLNETSPSQRLLALASGIAPVGWYGSSPTSGAGTMVTAVAAIGHEQQRLGFVGSAIYDQNRGTLNALAYQHYGQNCGYLPDSTPTSFDKANVRNGQYFLWSATHVFATMSGGTIVSPGAERIIRAITGAASPAPDPAILDALIQAGTIPQCAMRVSRTTDLGALASYAPPSPCGCYLEFRLDGVSTCAACDAGNPCTGSQVCRFGFCEDY